MQAACHKVCARHGQPAGAEDRSGRRKGQNAPRDPRRQDAGHIALQRGPVVYCLEEADNGPRLANVAVPANAALTSSIEPGLFGGAGVITGEAIRIEPAEWPGGLYQPQSQLKDTRIPFTFRAIPYAFWANRQPGEMRVWIREA